jgi:protein-disulfide isomerase
LCIIAAGVFALMSLFSAKYRPLAKEAFNCVFRTITLKPCDTGLDDRLKAETVVGLMKYSATAAKLVNKYFSLMMWAIVLLSIGSLAYTIYSGYNFYQYGNCEGAESKNACVLNDLTGDYGRFSSPTDLVVPKTLDGIAEEERTNAKITVVEFGCFTCPYTKKAEDTITSLLKEYNGSIYYVFKPFPLPNHNNSFEAARAVLCAEKQGRQWELRREIFRQQEVCSADGTLAIKKIAETAGLNMTTFNDCYDGNETSNALSRYVQEGKDSHIYATPTFFVNNRTIVGPKTLDQFKCIINNEQTLMEQTGCLFGQWWGK